MAGQAPTWLSPPPRWMLCPRRGKPVDETHFVPFKVPLDARYDDVVKPLYRFTPTMLLDAFRSENKDVGLVIDLTKTDRYYNRGEFESQGARVVKLPCEGFGSVPPNNRVDVFISICKSFWQTNPDKYIAVHCTHGYNRTGYMICSYLVREYGFSIEAAVRSFADARAPGIYKREYIEKLFEAYDGDPNAIMVPELPDWDVPDEPTTRGAPVQPSVPLAGTADGATTTATGLGSKKRPRGNRADDDDDDDDDDADGRQVRGLVGVEGKIIGEQIGGDKCRQIQSFMQQMCNFRGGPTTFPGAQPVSMDLDNFDLYITRDAEQEWLVSWKADGTRYLMAIMSDGVYMTDRDFRIYRVPHLVFPSRADLATPLNNTLIDGELVEDKVDEKTTRPRLLMFDLIALNGRKVGTELTFSERLQMLEAEVIGPREQLRKTQPARFAQEPFGVRVKKFFRLQDFDTLVKSTVPSLPHKTDGYIFTPVNHPYNPGANPNLLKWKPMADNSIDFCLKVKAVQRSGMLPETVAQLCVIGEKGNLIEFSRITTLNKQQLAELNGKIIECNPVRDQFGTWHWKFHRVRDDKSHPNANTTAEQVRKSLNRGITDPELMRLVHEYVAARSKKRPVVPS